MKTKICYNANVLKDILAKRGYNLVNLNIVHEDEDWGDYKTTSCYFAKPEVKSVNYCYSFITNATLLLHDGTQIHMLADNVNANDLTAVRIDHNDYLSPRFSMDDVWIEARDVITNWLIAHGVSKEILQENIKQFEIYETIEYPGVSTPSKEFGSWAYSSKNLVLDEREINTALNSIEDELLRKKIECILYARVFKRK